MASYVINGEQYNDNQNDDDDDNNQQMIRYELHKIMKGDDSDENLEYTLLHINNGVIINNNVYLTYRQWHVIVYINENLFKCGVCQLYFDGDNCDDHVKLPSHISRLKLIAPLKKYDLCIVRKINDTTYHCGVCSVIIAINDFDKHENTKDHEHKLLFAINKVSDINIANGTDKKVDEKKLKKNTDVINFNKNSDMINDNVDSWSNFNINNDNRNDIRNNITDNDYQSHNRINDNEYRSYNPNNNITGNDNGNNDITGNDNRNDITDNDNRPNDTNNQLTAEEYNEYNTPQEGMSYANMASKPKIEMPEFLKIKFGSRIFVVRYEIWHMVCQTKVNELYCMVCKQVVLVRNKYQHCTSREHNEKLNNCYVVCGLESYLVRKVCEKFYHCGVCNNLQNKDYIKSHIEAAHPKNTLTDNKQVTRYENPKINNLNDKTNDIINRDNDIIIIDDDNEVTDNEDNGTLNQPNIKYLIVSPFANDIIVSLLAYNTIMERDGENYCVICDCVCENPLRHIREENHEQLLALTPYIRVFQNHLTRAIRGSLHCTICNKLIPVKQIYQHNFHTSHTDVLASSLGVIKSKTPLINVKYGLLATNQTNNNQIIDYSPNRNNAVTDNQQRSTDNQQRSNGPIRYNHITDIQRRSREMQHVSSPILPHNYKTFAARTEVIPSAPPPFVPTQPIKQIRPIHPINNDIRMTSPNLLILPKNHNNILKNNKNNGISSQVNQNTNDHKAITVTSHSDITRDGQNIRVFNRSETQAQDDHEITTSQTNMIQDDPQIEMARGQTNMQDGQQRQMTGGQTQQREMMCGQINMAVDEQREMMTMGLTNMVIDGQNRQMMTSGQKYMPVDGQQREMMISGHINDYQRQMTSGQTNMAIDGQQREMITRGQINIGQGDHQRHMTSRTNITKYGQTNITEDGQQMEITSGQTSVHQNDQQMEITSGQTNITEDGQTDITENGQTVITEDGQTIITEYGHQKEIKTGQTKGGKKKRGRKENNGDMMVDDVTDNTSEEEFEKTMNKIIFLKLKSAYFKITVFAYHSLVLIDSSRYCFVCSITVPFSMVFQHIDSRSHVDNLNTNKFLDKYNLQLLRQMYFMYHCAICNVLMSRKEIKTHLNWNKHVENYKKSFNTKKNQKILKNKNIIQYKMSTQREIIYLQEKEQQYKITSYKVIDEKNYLFDDAIGINNRTINEKIDEKIDLFDEAIGINNRTTNEKIDEKIDLFDEATGIDDITVSLKTDLIDKKTVNKKTDFNSEKKHKIIIVNDKVLKIKFENWHGIVEEGNCLKCILCQKFLECGVFEHIRTNYHRISLGRDIEKAYYPSLVRKIDDTKLNCIICNVELQIHTDIYEHLYGEQHIKIYDDIANNTAIATTYTDCYENVLNI